MSSKEGVSGGGAGRGSREARRGDTGCAGWVGEERGRRRGGWGALGWQGSEEEGKRWGGKGVLQDSWQGTMGAAQTTGPGWSVGALNLDLFVSTGGSADSCGSTPGCEETSPGASCMLTAPEGTALLSCCCQRLSLSRTASCDAARLVSGSSAELLSALGAGCFLGGLELYGPRERLAGWPGLPPPRMPLPLRLPLPLLSLEASRRGRRARHDIVSEVVEGP